MKKVVAVVLAMLLLIGFAGLSESAVAQSIDQPIATMNFANELKARLKALSLKTAPTATDAELCFMYAEAYGHLARLAGTELFAISGTDKPDNSVWDGYFDSINSTRSYYEQGWFTPEVVIGIIVPAVCVD